MRAASPGATRQPTALAEDVGHSAQRAVSTVPEGGFSVRPSGLRSEYVAPVVSIIEMDAAQLLVTLVGLAFILGILLYFFGPRRT